MRVAITRSAPTATTPPGMRTRSLPWLAIPVVALIVVFTGGAVMAAGPADVVKDGPNDRREIALTIDDGYDVAVCRQMVRTLRAMDVPATFFPIGRAVRANPGFWKNVSKDFPIANHTGFHGLLPPLEKERVRRQIRSAEWAVQSVTGKPVMKVLRPPGGAWDDRIRRIAGNLGYEVLMLWDVSSADTGLRSTAKGMLRAATRGGRGSVILLHCNRQVSADILPKIIRSYRKRGFRFVTVDHLLARRGYEQFRSDAMRTDDERKAARKARRQDERASSADGRGADESSDTVPSTHGWWAPMNDAIDKLLVAIRDQ